MAWIARDKNRELHVFHKMDGKPFRLNGVWCNRSLDNTDGWKEPISERACNCLLCFKLYIPEWEDEPVEIQIKNK